MINKNIGSLTKADVSRLEKWETFYHELYAFHKKFGHCLVSDMINYKELTRWVSNQRLRKKKGVMTAQEEDLLNALDFVWQAGKVAARPEKLISWEKRYEKLKEYIDQSSHDSTTAMISQISETRPDIYKWLLRMRSSYNSHTLSEDRIKQLNDLLGEEWSLRASNVIKKNWQQRYEQLKQFHKKYNHCDVRTVHHHRSGFAVWVDKQKVKYLADGFIGERKRLLDELNFGELARKKLTNAEKWEVQYNRLLHFYEEYGHLEISNSYDLSLKLWLKNQKFRKQALTEEQVEKLDKLGVDWQVKVVVRDEFWFQRCEEYKKFIESGRGDEIKKKSPNGTEGKSFYYWKTKQRSHYQIGYPFTGEQMEKLNEIGVLDGLMDNG